MNLGTENKKKTIAAAALGVVAVALLIYELYPSSSAPVPVAAPSASLEPARPGQPAATPIRRPGQKTVTLPRINSLDPTIRLDMLQAAEAQHYHSSGRNIFEARAAEVAQAPRKKEPPPPPVAYVPPPPPPINLHFYGFTSKSAGGPTRVFLSQGDEVFIASEGDLVANRYKVIRINPTSIDVEDVLNNNQQTLPLQVAPHS